MTRQRVSMKTVLKEQDIEGAWEYRTINKDDVLQLGMLMLESYRETIDYEGESVEDAILEVEGTFYGKYGPFLRECSVLIEEGGCIASACLVVYSGEMRAPLITYVMTHPGFQGQGMATFLLKVSMNELLKRGYTEVYLVVTAGNPAQKLYEEMGFCEIRN